MAVPEVMANVVVEEMAVAPVVVCVWPAAAVNEKASPVDNVMAVPEVMANVVVEEIAVAPVVVCV